MNDAVTVSDRVIDQVSPQADAEVLVLVGDDGLTRFANSVIHQNVGETDRRVILKLWEDGRPASATTSRVDDDGLAWLVEGALAAAKHQMVDVDYPGLAPPTDIPAVEHYDEETATASPEQRAEVVQDFIEAGDGSAAAGYCSTGVLEVAYGNSSGQRASGRSTEATVDGIHAIDGAAGSGHQTALRLAELDGSAMGELAADRARAGAEPGDLEPGSYEVVLAPECAATIAFFLAYYGLNGKALSEGRSFVEIGAQQFDRQISIWDDALDPRALGLPFDFQGTPKRRVDFITDGVTTSVAHDRRSAKKTDTTSTGHALPQMAQIGPVPINLFIGTGDTSVEEMISSVERGLYVSTFNYCRVLDPKTLVVTGLTRNGTFLIENGERVGAVRNLRFTQSFIEALGEGNILGIESTSRFADSELGSGLVIAPSTHLAEWNFTGNAEG